MTTTIAKKNMPELRFPGFSNGWKQKRISEILTICSGKDYKHLKVGDIPVFGTGGLMTRVDDFLYDGESVFIGRKGSIDKPTYFSGKFWTVDTLFYTNNFKEVTPKFVYRLFRNVNWIKYNEASGVPSLSKSTVESIKVYIPHTEEQLKVAGFFDDIDDLLRNLKTQKQKLEEYKRGIMQKIFSQEVRFKDDNRKDFPEWKEVPLKEVLKKRSVRNNNSEYKNVLTNSAQHGIVNQSEYFNKDIANQDNLTNYYVVETDDFVYNPRISKFAPVGPFKRNKNGRGIMSPLYTILKLSKGNLSFYEYYFDTNLWHRYMFKISNFGARHDRMNIRGEDFMKMPIPFPDTKEQEKIASFLIAIDKLISMKAEQVKNAETWKKGLLQKMFV
jgi:type I restriction enzyme S subunit